MDSVFLTIAGDPVAKGRPRFNRQSGRTYTPAKTSRFEAYVKQEARLAMRGREPIDGPVKVQFLILLTPPRSWSESVGKRP